MYEQEQTGIIRAVFDALPSLVFVVDHDVRIQEHNRAASELLMSESTVAIKGRAGDILHCLHAHEAPEGCGRAPFCADCIIRNSVREALEGNRVERRRTRMELTSHGNRVEMYALITTSPFTYLGRQLALLVIEDFSEMAELQRMIPVCVACKKVRDDKDAWVQIESYFKRNWDVDFTHGYCPECYKIEMDKLKVRFKSESETE